MGYWVNNPIKFIHEPFNNSLWISHPPRDPSEEEDDIEDDDWGLDEEDTAEGDEDRDF